MNQVQKNLLIAAVFYFVLWNSQYFLDSLPQPLDFFVIPFLAVYLITIGVFALGQLLLFIIEKFKKLNRLVISMSIIALLPLAYFYPRGLIRFERYFESENLLVASNEGVANCATTLSFKKNNRFKKREVCFGVSTTWGRYYLSNDTLYMKFNRITDENGEGAYSVLTSCYPKHSYTCLKYFQNKDDKRWLQFGIDTINSTVFEKL